MLCKCKTKMKVFDTRQNVESGETYRKYVCPECKAVSYTLEDAVEADRYFLKQWRLCDRQARRKKYANED